MDSTKEKNSITVNPGAVSGTCGTSYLGFGAVPPTYSNVTITSTGTTTTPIYTTGTGVSNPWASTNSTGKLNLDGDQADIVINGKSLGAAIAKIEQRLNILVPNSELEAEWAELKKLGDAYRKLEQDLTEKADIWKVLKKI